MVRRPGWSQFLWALPDTEVASVLLDLTVLSSPSRMRGIGRYVADLASGITDSSVVGLERLSWNGAIDTASDLPAAVRRLLSDRQRTGHAGWAYRTRLLLARAARRAEVELVHSGHPEATPLARGGFRRVVTCHDLIELSYPDRYLSWRDGWAPGRLRLDRRRFGSADHVIAVSETTANDLVTKLGILARKITVVHNGVDLTRWSARARPSDDPVLECHGLSPRGYALYVGGSDWRKNPEGMCSALAAVPELELAWAGKLGDGERRSVEAIADRAGVLARVRLLGYVRDDELAALRRGALAELFVSRAEGFGYPVIEAMASGCPVITSNRSSMAEIAGDAALSVDPEDSAAIADALSTVVRSSAERVRLREAGLSRCRRFGVDRMVAGTLDVYRRVLGDH